MSSETKQQFVEPKEQPTTPTGGASLRKVLNGDVVAHVGGNDVVFKQRSGDLGGEDIVSKSSEKQQLRSKTD